MTREKINEATLYCYIELYKNATPSADFNELLKNAENIDGKKQIPFMNYEIESKKLDFIIDETIKRFKIKKGYWSDAFRGSILLGCSPKTKI